MKYGDITEKIIGCAMDVHSCLGAGFREINYHRSLIIAFELAGLEYGSEVERIIYYKDSIVGKRRLDLVVEKKY